VAGRENLNPSPELVGAAAGCDLLMLLLTAESKDRSLRQLLSNKK
jgi:hypothetical protein